MRGKQQSPGFLFPSRILHVDAVIDGDAVPVMNGSDAVYATDPKGRRWVRKVLIGANDILAESIGWLLCDRLGIPTPLGAVCGRPGDASWLSEYIPHTTHWSEARAQSLTNPDDLGAMLALDALIGNWDRHAKNLLLTPDPTPDRLKVYSIDVANAWIGTPSDIAKRGLESPDVDKLAHGIPVDMIRDGATVLAERAAQLPENLLSEFAMEACFLAGSSGALAIGTALHQRCAEAPRIVRGYLAKIESRP